MSSQQPFSTGVKQGEVIHIQHLSDQLGKLHLSDQYSDITLIVDSNRFSAHKVILAARSEYFRALLFGGMRESSQSEIELKDTPLVPFKHLLKYIYTGQICLSSFKEELILEVLTLAHQYGFDQLQTAISNYLQAILTIKTVCLIYDTASFYNLTELMEAALIFMDRNADEVLSHESFTSLSEASLKEIISRDSFCAEEIEIFRAIASWSRTNPDIDVKDVLSHIRLSLINIKDLLKVVRPTELMPPDILLDAIQSRHESKDTDLRYRGYKILDENVAVPRHGASVLVGEVKTALLDGDSKNYDMERGFSRHPIDDSKDKGIVVKLGMPCIINRIKMLLWDRDQRAYSYYIEVSMDQQDWVRVIDHSTYHCRSWQDLHFSPRVVRFLRIVGTHNTVNKVFHVVTLEAMYTQQAEKIELGLIVPRTNVATLERSALVIEGVCRSRNALLNGDTSNYDWDNGYTCHQLGSGAIMVQLGQPYALDSLRMLLWDCDERSYSYYIEVSTNQTDWEIVCDRTRDNCRSWQLINFKCRPVAFIRIVGTHNTANEVFHCVHFEAPAMSDSQGVRVSPSPPSGRSDEAQSTASIDEEEDIDARNQSQAGSEHSSDEANNVVSPPFPLMALQGMNPPFGAGGNGGVQGGAVGGAQGAGAGGSQGGAAAGGARHLDAFQLPLVGGAGAGQQPPLMPLQGLGGPRLQMIGQPIAFHPMGAQGGAGQPQQLPPDIGQLQLGPGGPGPHNQLQGLGNHHHHQQGLAAPGGLGGGAGGGGGALNPQHGAVQRRSRRSNTSSSSSLSDM